MQSWEAARRLYSHVEEDPTRGAESRAQGTPGLASFPPFPFDLPSQAWQGERGSSRPRRTRFGGGDFARMAAFGEPFPRPAAPTRPLQCKKKKKSPRSGRGERGSEAGPGAGRSRLPTAGKAPQETPHLGRAKEKPSPGIAEKRSCKARAPQPAGSRPGRMGMGVPGAEGAPRGPPAPRPPLTPLVRATLRRERARPPLKWLLDRPPSLRRRPEEEEAPPRGLREELPEDRAPRWVEDSRTVPAWLRRFGTSPRKMHWGGGSPRLLPGFPDPLNSDCRSPRTREAGDARSHVQACNSHPPSLESTRCNGTGGVRKIPPPPEPCLSPPNEWGCT